MDVRAHSRMRTIVLIIATLLCAGFFNAPAAQADPSAHSGRGHGGHRCTRALPVGTSTVMVPFRGTRYPVLISVPRAPRRADLPLVLDLHGSNSNGVAQADISDLNTLGQREGFIVAEPTAAIALPTTTPLPQGNWAWNVPGVPTTAGQFPPADARDDIAYLTAVVDYLDALGCVDDRRVYATGFSGGGRMASALACARPDVIAAIAPVAGLRAGRPDPADTTVPEAATCRPRKPVAVVTFHGDADFVNPYPGSPDLRWGYSVDLAVSTWADLNACRRGPRTKRISEHVSRVRYTQCRQHADVVLYRVSGGGHTWPGTDVDLSPLGVTTPEINASEIMWRFFEKHPRSRR